MYRAGFDVEMIPSPGEQLGAVWSACRASGCDPLSDRTRVDILWSDSGDGEVWSTPSLVQGSAHADQQINDSPTAVWLDGGAAVVGYTSRTPGWTSYAMFLRVGP